MIDLEKALLDPSSVFKTPDDVLKCQDLTNKQKIKILRQWKYDALELEVAEEENMGGKDVDILDKIVRALNSIDTHDHERSPPTKQGGE